MQFRLLREDFVRPLREGIQVLLTRMDPNKKEDIRLYKDVQVLYPVCASKKFMYNVKFDNSKFRHMRWENSKRLTCGSLLCLSKDNFDTFIFATVEIRDEKDLKKVKKSLSSPPPSPPLCTTLSPCVPPTLIPPVLYVVGTRVESPLFFGVKFCLLYVVS